MTTQGSGGFQTPEERTAKKPGRLLFLTLVCAALLSSCSDSESDEQDPRGESDTGMPAGAVCDGTLSGDAAQALEDISGQASFGEPVGSPPVDLATYLDVLRNSQTRAEFCRIHTPADHEVPYATVDFSWREVDPSEDPYESGDVVYETAAYAYATDGYAALGFRCDGVNSDPGKLLNGRLFVRRDSGAVQDQSMEIINAISRSVARGLECLDQSGLVDGAPERTPE